MHLAASISEHPVVAHAVGECVGDVLERRGDSPDLLILGISDRLWGATEDIVSAVAKLLQPEVMVGLNTSSLSVGARVSHAGASLGILAMWHTRPVSTAGRTAVEPDWRVRASQRVVGIRIGSDLDVAHLGGAAGTMLLFADPFSAPLTPLLEQIQRVAPHLVVMAACPDGVRRASLAKLLMGDDIHSDGAVGVLFPPEFPRQLLCSVGFTPIGPKFVVGGVGGQRIRELASQPAAEVLSRTLEGLAPNERAAAAQGLHLRWIVPPVSDVESFGLPELGLVLGVDGDSVVFAGDRPAGANSIQFQLRDQESVDSDLRRVLGTGAGLLGGLFLVADRPERGGSEIDHIGQDAQIISEGLSSTEVLGLRCGEVALLDRGEFRSANRAVTILGLSG